MESNPAKSMFITMSSMAAGAVNIAQKQAQRAGNVVGEVVSTTVDTLGLKSHVEAAEKAARKAAHQGRKNLFDANKAVNKARRLANKALDFEDDDESLINSDYDLLLSVPGATEKNVAMYGTFSQTFAIPAGSAFVWKARLRKHDIGFAVREVRSQDLIVDIEPMQRFRAEAPIQGQLSACPQPRNIMLVFDNSHSHIPSKRLVYWVACGENVSLADDALGAARSKEVAAAEEGPIE